MLFKYINIHIILKVFYNKHDYGENVYGIHYYLKTFYVLDSSFLITHGVQGYTKPLILVYLRTKISYVYLYTFVCQNKYTT